MMSPKICGLKELKDTSLEPFLTESWQYWFDHNYTKLTSAMDYLQWLRHEDETRPKFHLAAAEENQVLGLISVSDKDYPPIPEYPGPWLVTIYTAQAARGKGIAGMLYAACFEHVRQLGYSALYLQAMAGTEPLHEKAGFVMVEKYRSVMCKQF